MLNIGFDAFRLITEPRTSGAVYINELVTSWIQLPEVEQIILYVPRQPGPDFEFPWLLTSSKVLFVAPTRPAFPERNFRAQMLWVQFSIPSLVRSSPRLDYFVAPYHHTPVRIYRHTRVVTVIHDLCGLQYPWNKKGLYRHLAMFLTASFRTDMVVCISKFTQQRLEAVFPSLSRRVLGVVYNGVDSITLPLEQAQDLVCRQGLTFGQYFVWIGALSQRKGVDILLEAYRRYEESGGKAPLVVVVNKAAIAEIKAMAESFGVTNVQVLSGVSAEVRDALYQGALAMLFPSRCEGFGYPVVEAMRQGCPPVAWEHGPTRELVDGLVPMLSQLDPTELAGVMSFFERMPEGERQKLAGQLTTLSGNYTQRQFGVRFFQLLTKSN